MIYATAPIAFAGTFITNLDVNFFVGMYQQCPNSIKNVENARKKLCCSGYDSSSQKTCKSR